MDQCRGELLSEEQQTMLSEWSQSQVYGFLKIRVGGGSFHSPGKSVSLNHLHDVQPFSTTDYNLTHTVRHLSFWLNVYGKTDSMYGVIGVNVPVLNQYFVNNI